MSRARKKEERKVGGRGLRREGGKKKEREVGKTLQGREELDWKKIFKVVSNLLCLENYSKRAILLF